MDPACSLSPDEAVHDETGRRRKRRLTSESLIIVPDNFDLVYWVTETPENGARVTGLTTQKEMRKMFLIQVVSRPGVKPCSFEAEYRWAWIEAEEPNLAGFETIRVSPEGLKQILTLIQAFVRECDVRNRHASRIEKVRTSLCNSRRKRIPKSGVTIRFQALRTLRSCRGIFPEPCSQSQPRQYRCCRGERELVA
jgi:hypothetical protein